MSSFNIIVKKIFVSNFPFLITDSLKPFYPLKHNNSQNVLSMMIFLLMLAKCLARVIKEDTSKRVASNPWNLWKPLKTPEMVDTPEKVTEIPWKLG